MVEGFEWHAARRKAILRAHPEVKALYGRDATTALWVLALAALQIGLTHWAGTLSWSSALLLAYLVGAFVAHALGVLVHEASHNLVFRSIAANKLLAIAANVPLGAPAAIEFRAQHALHHRHLGDADGSDTQAPTRHEARVVRSAWAKLASFTLGRFYFRSRPANHVHVDRWMVLNWAACLAYGALVLASFGVKSFVFGLVAALVAFGPHALGARRIAEHLTARRGQPTNSYYGGLNRLSFDVGYHVEHHDFPNIPWRRLRALRRIAPEAYEPLFTVRSWTRLMVSYVFDPRYRVDQYIGMGGDWLEEVLDSRRDGVAGRVAGTVATARRAVDEVDLAHVVDEHRRAARDLHFVGVTVGDVTRAVDEPVERRREGHVAAAARDRLGADIDVKGRRALSAEERRGSLKDDSVGARAVATEREREAAHGGFVDGNLGIDAERRAALDDHVALRAAASEEKGCGNDGQVSK